MALGERLSHRLESAEKKSQRAGGGGTPRREALERSGNAWDGAGVALSCRIKAANVGRLSWGAARNLGWLQPGRASAEVLNWNQILGIWPKQELRI